MPFNQAYFPYDEVITAGDESNWGKLSVTTKGKEIPCANIEFSGNRLVNISVPLTLFSGLYNTGEVYADYTCKGLNEIISVKREGMVWVITQIHDEGVGQVIVDNEGNFYKVDGVDSTREYNIKLSNGCIKCYNKGENLLAVDNVKDFYEKW